MLSFHAQHYPLLLESEVEFQCFAPIREWLHGPKTLQRHSICIFFQLIMRLSADVVFMTCCVRYCNNNVIQSHIPILEMHDILSKHKSQKCHCPTCHIMVLASLQVSDKTLHRCCFSNFGPHQQTLVTFLPHTGILVLYVCQVWFRYAQVSAQVCPVISYMGILGNFDECSL